MFSRKTAVLLSVSITSVSVLRGDVIQSWEPSGVSVAPWAKAMVGMLAMIFLEAMSITMIIAPRLLISVFLDTADPKNAPVVELAISFLMLAALFQIADGGQTVGAGMLRGLHDARVPMLYDPLVRLNNQAKTEMVEANLRLVK